jgi:hypothetical protein
LCAVDFQIFPLEGRSSEGSREGLVFLGGPSVQDGLAGWTSVFRELGLLSTGFHSFNGGIRSTKIRADICVFLRLNGNPQFKFEAKGGEARTERIG